MSTTLANRDGNTPYEECRNAYYTSITFGYCKSMEKLYCITTFFNPARFKSLLRNYFVFAEHIKASGVKLLTIELAFNDDEFQIPLTDDVRRLRSHSILWQKERLINYGLSQIPPSENVAWLDCDVLFPILDWPELLNQKLETATIVQPFKRVQYLTKGEIAPQHGVHYAFQQGVIWQYKIYKNWFERRKSGDLLFSVPGYAWAAKTEVFKDIGMYDRNIVGSGDAFLVDCFLDKFSVHDYYTKLSPGMRQDTHNWYTAFRKKKIVVDYLPLHISHMWHGSHSNRQYKYRQNMVQEFDFDPTRDIKLENNVYEWNSNKPELHEALRQYFYDRKEDE